MLSIPSEPWPPRLMMDDGIDLWPELSSPSGSPQKNIPEPFVSDPSDPYENQFSFAFGTPEDSMSPSHSENDTEAMAISICKTTEDDYQLYCRSGTPLSQGILYNDVIHKYDSVLAMCEFNQVKLTVRQIPQKSNKI